VRPGTKPENGYLVVLCQQNDRMTYDQEKILQIREICFSNEAQLAMAIDTRRYLDTHYAQEIDLETLAQMECTSQYHLIRVFSRYFGITPRQYLINKRISAAKKLLRSGASVSDACYNVGYESLGSFSNLFRAKTGLSPSAFRRATFDKSIR
jgi:AraC-like DNA-binding protein